MTGNNHLIAVDSISGWLTFAAQESPNNILLLGLDIFRSPSSPSFSGYRISGIISNPQSIAISSDGTSLLVGAAASFVSPITANSVLTLIDITMSCTSATWGASYTSNMFINKQFANSKMSSFSSSFYQVAELQSPDYGLVIIRKVGITYETYIYMENTINPLRVLDIRGMTATKCSIFVQNLYADYPTNRIVEFDFIGGGQLTITIQLIKRPFLSTSELLGAYLKVSGEFLISGTRTSWSTCITSAIAPNSIGFLTNSLESTICGASGIQATQATFDISQSSPLNVPLTTTFSQQLVAGISGSVLAVPFTMSSATAGGTSIASSKLDLTHNTCCYLTVTPPIKTPAIHRYIVDYPEEEYSYPSFSVDPGQCTDYMPFWYTVQQLSPSLTIPIHTGTTIWPIPSPQPSGPIFYFDWEFPKFRVWIPHPTPYGGTSSIFYTLQVTGQLSTRQDVIGPSFQIEVYNIPPSATISPFYVPSLTYIVSQEMQNITWQGFTPSMPLYVIYYLEGLNGQVYNMDVDMDVFNFTQGGKQTKLGVYTKDNKKVKIYNLRIKAKYTQRTPMNCVQEFQVIILHQCFLTKIKTTYLPQTLEFEMTVPTSQPEIFKFENWDESVGVCKPFKYKALMSNGDYLPSFIQFFPNIREFNIQQTKEMVPGEYLIVLTGVLENYYMIQSLSMTVIIKCNVVQIKSIQPEQTLNYIVGSPPLRLQIEEFIQTPRCEKPIEYEATLSNGKPLPKDYFYFYNDLNALGIRELSISFGAQTPPKQDNFTVHVNGYIDSDYAIGQKKVVGTLIYNFKVRQTQQFIQAEYPPIYLILRSGEQRDIPFGPVGNLPTLRNRILQDSIPPATVDFKKFTLQYISGALSSDSLALVGSMQPPSRYIPDQGVLTISPAEGTPSGTRYILKSEITDKDATKFRITQNVIVLIYQGDADQGINIDDVKSEMMKLLAQTQKEYESNGIGNQGTWAPSQKKKKKDSALKARIDQIDEWGIVYVKFSIPVFVINNLTFINPGVLDLKIVSDSQGVRSSISNSRNLNFTWDCINMTNTQLKIRLNFSDPTSISIYQVKDQLQITFTDWAEILFQPILNVTSSSSNLKPQKISMNITVLNPFEKKYEVFVPVLEDFQMYYPLSVQLVQSNMTQSFQNAMNIVSTGLSWSLVINFVLAVILKFSMKYVWGIIHFLQVVTHMPMLIPMLPANYQVVLKVIYDIARLKIIPKEYMVKAVKWVKGVFNIKQGGESNDPIYENLGNILLAVTVFSIALGLIILVAFLARRFKSVASKIDKLKYKIMFGAFLTTITKGHLNMAVKMLGQLTGTPPPYISENQSEKEGIRQTSPVLPIIVFTILCVAPFFVLLFLRWNSNKLEQEQFKAQYGALYTNIKTNKERPDQYCFNVAFLIRRVLYALCINDLVFQISGGTTSLLFNVILQSLLSGSLVIYVATCQPFEEKRDNYIEMFNEMSILILFLLPLAGLIVDEDILGPQSRLNLGYVLIGILLLNLLVNYTIFFISISIEIYKRLKKLYLKKCKKTRSDQYKNDDNNIDDDNNNKSAYDKYLNRKKSLREVNGVYVDDGILNDHYQPPNDPTPVALYNKNDPRDPLRYIKAEMAMKFEQDIMTFGKDDTSQIRTTDSFPKNSDIKYDDQQKNPRNLGVIEKDSYNEYTQSMDPYENMKKYETQVKPIQKASLMLQAAHQDKGQQVMQIIAGEVQQKNYDTPIYFDNTKSGLSLFEEYRLQNKDQQQNFTDQDDGQVVDFGDSAIHGDRPMGLNNIRLIRYD